MASHIVVLGFELEYGAEGMLNDIQKWHEEGLVELEDAAIATSTPDGTIQIKQTHKKDDQFALKGGGVGLLAGLLAWWPSPGTDRRRHCRGYQGLSEGLWHRGWLYRRCQ